MSELEIYHIPNTNENFPGDTDNPGNFDVGSGGAAIDNSTSGSGNSGLTEQQVRDIVNSTKNNLTESRVREIVSSMQKFLTGQNVLIDGIQRSQNYVPNTSGWQWTPFDVEINTGTFKIGGTIVTVSDISLLQDSIDSLSSQGGGIIALVPDTYDATGLTFTIPSGVTVDGNGATIDFGGSAGQFLIQGTNAYSTGTLTATYGSAAVVGSGTTWTAGMVGQSILIGDYWYTILTRTDNTHITIEYSSGNGFIGTSVSGANYIIATTVDGVGLNNVTLANSSTSALKYRYVNGLAMDGLSVSGSGQSIDGDDSANVTLGNYFMDDCVVGIDYKNVPFCVFKSGLISNITGGTGLALDGVTNTALDSLSIQAITGVGSKLTNCSNFGYSAFSIIECTSNGLELVSGNNDVDILSGYVNTCGGDGIKFTATSDRNTIVACSFLNNTGYGVNIAASSCDDNKIIAPAFSNNTAGNINDSGTGTFVAPQTLSSNVQTFLSSGTWTKPSSGSMALIQAWGGGGSGSKGGNDGGGGGGAAYVEAIIPLSSLGSTETITIGDGGASQASSDTSGSAGGNTTVGSLLTAYGGGAGFYGTNAPAGGGGGGTSSIGLIGTATLGGSGGGPIGATGGTGNGGTSIFGGGAGGGNSGSTGGESIYGGGGGGSNGVGGNSVYGGGGGGAIGAGGTSTFGGSGGASGGNAGSVPGGGGGGSNNSVNSGAGGKGKVIITTF